MVKKHKLGPYGGGGGAPFFLDNITKIDKISVAYTVNGTNSFINAITITCIADGTETTHTWGKASGTTESFTLETGEYITSVKGYYGASDDDDLNVVRQLKIVTTKKEKTYGIEEVGTPFELPVNNGKIVGFHGRAGQLLDSLGVFIIEVVE